MSQCPSASNLSDQPYNPAIVFWSLRINRPVTWVWKIAPVRIVIRIRHGDPSNQFCPYFADQLFGAYLGRVLGLATDYGVRSSFPARPKKIFFREGTPELASPCRLFGRRNQTALAPYKAILKQRCVPFNGNRRGLTMHDQRNLTRDEAHFSRPRELPAQIPLPRSDPRGPHR